MSQKQSRISLSLTEEQHAKLHCILHPGDGLEAVAFLLCGRRAGQNIHRLVAKEVYCLPKDAYISRSEIHVKWSTDYIVEPIFDKAEKEKLSVVKIHSHPSGCKYFSQQDDESDEKLFPCITSWVEADIPHVSAIMLPDGEMFGRYQWGGRDFQPVERITVVGSDLKFWLHQSQSISRETTSSHALAFGQKTIDLLSQLSIAVVGCSGTGSVVIEQLARLGVKELILVDPDKIEARNLNRILNSKKADIGKYKTEVLKEVIEGMELGTKVYSYPMEVKEPKANQAVAECDVIFGCVDTNLGRLLLNTLATHYVLPYFDVGVRLEATDGGGISQVFGCVGYLTPGQSSLRTRGRISMAAARGEGLKQSSPHVYQEEVRRRYIINADEPRPAVISVNMFYASLMMNDFLHRLHPYREKPIAKDVEIEFCLRGLDVFHESEEKKVCDKYLRGLVGHGDPFNF